VNGVRQHDAQPLKRDSLPPDWLWAPGPHNGNANLFWDAHAASVIACSRLQPATLVKATSFKSGNASANIMDTALANKKTVCMQLPKGAHHAAGCSSQMQKWQRMHIHCFLT
jgi:hypothetical protein